MARAKPPAGMTAIYVKDGKTVPSRAAYDYSWEHFDLAGESGKKALLDSSEIPDYVANLLITRETRPRVENIEEGLLVILRGVNPNPDEDSDDMISIRIWAQQNSIVTAQYRELQTTAEFYSRAQAGAAEASVSVLLAKLVSELFKKIESTILELADRVDSLEELVTEPVTADVRVQVSALRQQVVVFKRHLLPQREVVSALRYSNLDWLHRGHRDFHNENHERIMRNIEDLEMMRDKLNIFKEEVQYLLAERLNRNMYLLSIVTTIFLPLGFLTGLLGINIMGIPGADYPYAFWVFCGLLAIVVLLQLIIFKRKKWF